MYSVGVDVKGDCVKSVAGGGAVAVVGNSYFWSGEVSSGGDDTDNVSAIRVNAAKVNFETSIAPP